MEPSVSENNKRIAKNTIMLYIRMFVMMAISLFTSRVVLEALGIEDYGIYNVVGGIVVLFTFVNNAMVSSTQRYLNYALGQNNLSEAQKIFSASLTIYWCLILLFIVLAETVGLWFLNNYINIPTGKEIAANWVYQFSIITTIINILRVPYNAVIIAYERMSFYAYLCIVEAIVNLAVVYALFLLQNKLIAYSMLVAVTALIIYICYYAFCRKNFIICKYIFNYDKKIYRGLISFSGWSIFGSFANISANYGLNILQNLFFGVNVNAAMGVSTQLNAAVYNFVGNFQTAFNPQIIKSYATGNNKYFIELILKSAKYSFYLLYIIALPVFICCPDILEIWLKEVPEYSITFCRIMLLYSAIDSLQCALWISAQANGQIKFYQILMSAIILLNIPFAYIAIKLFNAPTAVLIVRVLVNMLLAVGRVIYLNKTYGFPIKTYLTKVIWPAFVVILFSFPIPMIFYSIHNNIGGMILSILLSITIACIVIYVFGISTSERKVVQVYIKNRCTKRP